MAKAKKPESNLKQALIGSLLFSILAMAPVLPHFATYKFGPNFGGVGSDSYGFLYSMWIYAQPADGVLRTETTDLLTSFPTGRPIAKHIQLGSGAAYQLAGLGLPPVVAYNLITWLWFFLAYFMGFQILKTLRVSNGVAHLGALVIGLNPYQSLQAVDHIDLAMTWPLLLDIYLMLQLVLYRRIWAYPALVAMTGLLVFIHPYYLIFALFINVLPLFWFVIEMTLRKEKAKPVFIAAILLSIGVCGGATLFWRSLFSAQGGLASVERNIRELYNYSTKFWDFALPPHFSAPFARFTSEFKTEHTMSTGSNFVENTLYPGLLVLLTLAAVIIWICARRKESLRWVKDNKALAFVLANLLFIPILFSVSPSFNVFGFDLYSPTILVHKFLPQFRTMSRFGYVAALAMIMVFALVINSRFNTRGILIALGAWFIIDLGYFHKNFYSDTGKVPEVYTFLRDSTPPKSVIFEVPFMWGYLTTYWQSYHRRPNYAMFDPGDPNFMNMVRTNELDLGGLLSFARANKIDYLIVHSQQPLQVPFQKFETDPDDRWLFFMFAKYSYVIPVANTLD
jgi:hypothetical protein